MAIYAKHIGKGYYKLLNELEAIEQYLQYTTRTKKNHKKPVSMDEWLESENI